MSLSTSPLPLSLGMSPGSLSPVPFCRRPRSTALVLARFYYAKCAKKRLENVKAAGGGERRGRGGRASHGRSVYGVGGGRVALCSA